MNDGIVFENKRKNEQNSCENVIEYSNLHVNFMQILNSSRTLSVFVKSNLNARLF